MAKFIIQEWGRYSRNIVVEALSEEEAVEKVYKKADTEWNYDLSQDDYWIMEKE